MIDGPFREILPRYAEPLLKIYDCLGLKPNHITVTGFAFAIAAAVGTAQGLTLLPLALWWIGRLLDGTDGIYARSSGQTSDFGGYLDIVLDMASYSIMIVGFAHLHPHIHLMWFFVLFFYVLCITSALALGTLSVKVGTATKDNRSLTLAAGLAEGGETGLAYSVFLLFPGWIAPLVSIWLAILATTVLARTALAWQLLAKASESPDNLERD